MSAMASGPFVTEKIKSGVSAVVSAICAFPLVSGGGTGCPWAEMSPQGNEPVQTLPPPLTVLTFILAGEHNSNSAGTEMHSRVAQLQKNKKVGCITHIVTSQP